MTSNTTALYFEEIIDEDEVSSVNSRTTRTTNGLRLTCKILQSALFAGGGGSSLALLNDRAYVFGGCNRNGSCSSALTCFDLATSSCVELAGDLSSAPCARHGHSLLSSSGTNLILFGGQSAPSSTSPSVSLNDVHVYNTKTNVWSCLDPGSAKDESAEEYYGQALRPMPRNSFSIVVSNGKLILFGGSNAEVGPMNDMWALDLRQLEEENDVDSCKAGEHNLPWERIGGGHDDDAKDKTGDDGAMPWPEAREMHSACIVPLNDPSDDGKDHVGMLLMGGRKADGTTCRELWLFDIQTQSWRQLTGAAQPRCSHTSVYLPNENVVIFFGGWDGAGTIFGDILCFDLTSESWIDFDSTTVNGDRIPERFAHTACEDGTGSGLYIVGGVNAENDLQDLVHISLNRK